MPYIGNQEFCDNCGVEILEEDTILGIFHSACETCYDTESNMGHVLNHIKNFSNIVYEAEAFYYKDILEDEDGKGEEYYYRWIRCLKDKALYREWKREADYWLDYEIDEGIADEF